MSNQGQTNVVNGSGAIHPGSYIIEKALLHPSNKTEPVEIRDLIMELRIKESLSNAYIEAQAFLQDAGNFLSRMRLNGGERVELKIQRKKLEGSEQPEENQKLELDLSVIELLNYSRTHPTRQFFSLTMASPWLVINNSKVLKRSFKGTISSVIEKIIKNDLGVERIENLNTSSKGPVQGVFPYFHPIQAATWLLNNAYEDSTPFFLYETAHKGMYLDSLTKMYDKETFNTYELKSYFDNGPGKPGHYDELSKRILKFSSPLNYSQFANIGAGVYASKGNYLDIYNKKYETKEYRYKDNLKLNKFQPFSNNETVKDKKLNELTDSRDYYINLNEGSFDTPNIHSPLDKTILKGEAQYLALNTNTMHIVINGDFGLEVGNIIELEVSKASSAETLDEANMFDKYLGGKYLVKEIETTFAEFFKQRVTIVRDSVGIDIDSSDPEEKEKSET